MKKAIGLSLLVGSLLTAPVGNGITARSGAAATNVTPFVDISSSFTPTKEVMGVMTSGAVVFDYNNDGKPDVFIPDHHMNSLFRNNGDGTFTDVAAAAGVLGATDFGQGAVAFDYDNDGWRDLFVANGTDGMDLLDGSQEPGQGKDRLYRNNGNGTFTDVTDSAGVGDNRNGSGACVGDINNDGWLDFYVANYLDMDFWPFGNAGNEKSMFNGARNTLYFNNGNGTFTDITDNPGINVGTPPIPFYDNTGAKLNVFDPNLKDSKGRTVGENRSNSWACSFVDYDHDGDVDLFVATDQGYLLVYRNNRPNGTFTQVQRPARIDWVGAWMGFAWGDVDNDGDLDLFPSNFGNGVLMEQPASTPVFGRRYHHRFEWARFMDVLLRNDGNRAIPGYGQVGIFADVAPAAQVSPSAQLPPFALDVNQVTAPSATSPGWRAPSNLAAYDFGLGSAFFDYDNDGDLDLYWVGSLDVGGTTAGDRTPNPGRFLRNEGSLTSWTDISVEAQTLNIRNVNYATGENIQMNKHESGTGVAVGDLNGDGYDDLIVVSGMSMIDMTRMGHLQVFENGGGTNNWLKVRLVGAKSATTSGSNRDGIGAKVVVNLPNGKNQLRHAIAGDSSFSQHSLLQSFGLGNQTMASTITVYWPSGRKSVLTNVSANQIVKITEPAS